MRNHRFMTLAGAGSAVAATIAIWVVLFVPTPQTTVEAATIFASLRDAVGNAFDVRFENVGAEGIRVDGRAVVVFDRTEGKVTPFASEPKGVYVEARVRTDETAQEELLGLDLETAVGLVHGQEWVFVRINGLPQTVLNEQPMAGWLQQMARDGLLLDLDGLMEGELSDQIISELHFGHEEDDADEHHAEEDAHHTVIVHAHEGVAVHSHDDATPSERDVDTERLHASFQNMLTGKATAEDFEQLVSLIEQAATNVTVTETEPGLHVLTASGFTFEDDEEAAALMGNMALQIAYREEYGLAWAMLEHVGLYDGTIRLEMTEVTTDDELFNRERFMEDGKTRRFDVSQLIGMFKDAPDK